MLVGCRALSDQPNAEREPDGRPLVVTTFTVLADMARQVAGDRLRVHSITRIGAEVHGYEPSPADIKAAEGAALIVANGLGLERWATRFLAAAGAVPTVTLSEGITPLPISDDAAAGQPNPHAWMSPRRAQIYVDRLVEAFSQLDPVGAGQYSANGTAYKARLAQLDTDLRQTVAQLPLAHRLLVTCEGAFSYLARDYGLQEAYLWPVNGERQITPRRMARLIDTVQGRRVPAVFCESTVSDGAMRQVARAGGARFGGTFYVDSLSGPEGPAPTLLDLQRHNVTLIMKGLSGGNQP
ncbi:MAG: metal ABC transporter substrate-binding protein [Cyanobacteriota bacterium]|nr:metal ABC transporter substrate-binding protein [Cyanobacteriota bacterium]